MHDKISCEIAQDLMPLMIDQACSDQSAQAVKEHLQACEKCAQVYAAMQSPTPAPVTDQAAAHGFQKAMKKQARRFRGWQYLAICCAGLLAFLCVLVTLHPAIIYQIQQDVPVSWFQNAHLVRTEQGAILMQFTPPENYRHFFGSWSISTYFNENSQVTTVQYQYPWIAMALNKDFDDWDYTSRYEYADRMVLRQQNGDWLIAMPWGDHPQWVYQDGAVVELDRRIVNQQDILTLLEQGALVNGNSRMVFVHYTWKEGDTLKIKGPDGEKIVYQYGDEISLCSPEAQAQFDQRLQLNPEYFLLPGQVFNNLPFQFDSIPPVIELPSKE